jgi:hypothetical protein
MTDDESKPRDPRDGEWYAAALGAWYTTRLERDKSLLTLSAGGIGLLITLVSTVGIATLESLILFILAIIAFVTCLAAVLWIFARNSTHIEDVVHRNASNDPLLTVLDNVAVYTFLAGVVLSGIIGITAAARSLETKETDMSGSKKVTMIANDSVNGVLGMKPGQRDLTRSFNGVGRMAPGSQSTAQAQTSQAETVQAPAATAPAATAPAATAATAPAAPAASPESK